MFGWRLRNKEHISDYSAKWKKENPEKIRRKNSTRRAKERDAEGSHTENDLLKLREEQICCQSCNVQFSEQTPATVDHKTPLSRGGSNGLDNLHLLCKFCNSSKKAKTWDEYIEWKCKQVQQNT